MRCNFIRQKLEIQAQTATFAAKLRVGCYPV